MTSVEVVTGDITALEVDAIVNAANAHLQHGGGVALAIARAGGPTIQRESDEWVRANGPLSPGTAAVTSGGSLPAGAVIHVAGPRYREGEDNEGLLARTVAAALDAAAAHAGRSVALPAISAGIFGYPLEAATRVIAGTVNRWIEAHPDALDRVVLVGFDEATSDAFAAALADD